MSYVMVVDDEPCVREPIAWSLRLAGYQVGMAAGASAALAQMNLSKPLLLILDVQMPGMGGLELLERIRADSALADTPVLLLTAAADKELVSRAAKLGVKGYVLKASFSMQDLLARVGQHVKRSPAAAGPADKAAAPPAA